MDNSAWFTKQLHHWRDTVAWTAERALTEISSREAELYAFWTDQAARDYRSRYGALREELQAEIISALRRISTALESLEVAVIDIDKNAQLIAGCLTDSRADSDQVRAQIDATYRGLSDYESNASAVAISFRQAKAEMKEALALLDSLDADTPMPTSEVVPREYASGRVSDSDGSDENTHSDKTSIGEKAPLWSLERMFGCSPLTDMAPIQRNIDRVYSPPLASQSGLSTVGYGLTLASQVGSNAVSPSWAFRNGEELVLGFSTISPAGAVPFLGTAPAPATSYLSLRLGSDAKWSTPLGFGSSPRSYDLSLGTSALSLGGNSFEYCPPMSVSPSRPGLSTGGSLNVNQGPGLGAMNMDYGTGGWGGAFSTPCCLSS